MNYYAGNAYEAETHGTGWFVGFSDWTLAGPTNLLHIPKEQMLSGVCIKWYDHPTGDDSGGKPVSEGRTISILVSNDSEFRIDFCECEDFKKGVETVILKRHGDFAAWGEELYHRWHCISRSTIMTVRWQPEESPTAGDAPRRPYATHFRYSPTVGANLVFALCRWRRVPDSRVVQGRANTRFAPTAEGSSA